MSAVRMSATNYLSASDDLAAKPLGYPPVVRQRCCNCREANERHFGKKMAREPVANESFEIVPTEAKPDGSCAYCGYVSFWSTPTSERVPVKQRRRRNRPGAGRKGKPVIGVKLETGEELRFESAKEAKLAGHGAVSSALARGYVLYGIKWRLA